MLEKLLIIDYIEVITFFEITESTLAKIMYERSRLWRLTLAQSAVVTSWGPKRNELQALFRPSAV